MHGRLTWSQFQSVSVAPATILSRFRGWLSHVPMRDRKCIDPCPQRWQLIVRQFDSGRQARRIKRQRLLGSGAICIHRMSVIVPSSTVLWSSCHTKVLSSVRSPGEASCSTRRNFADASAKRVGSSSKRKLGDLAFATAASRRWAPETGRI